MDCRPSWGVLCGQGWGIRAERRLEEMIVAQKKTVGLAIPGPRPKKIGSASEPNSTIKKCDS